jgi:indole-3-glycerol phosphate synthase/phosphoribosylanthranilate isomerase
MRPGARFIMEVKKASPSGHRSHVSVERAVGAYAPIADAISVLTDGNFFHGSLQDLQTVRGQFDGPMLAKDFIVDPRQVTEARLHGADAVLAMLSVLDDAQTGAVAAEARRLGMDVIFEVHDEREMRRALAFEAQIIGINNRDLRTLQTDLAVTERLARLVPGNRIVISESGIRTRSDVEQLSRLANAFLVGSSLMASDDIIFAARALVHGPVKICGLTVAEDVGLAAHAGATHAGFIFAKDSPRRVARVATRLAASAHDHGLRAVGVFKDQPHTEVVDMARSLGLRAVQLHGGETGLDWLKAELPDDCEIWAVSGVDETVEPIRPTADRTLFDTRRGGRSGGSGKSFDWGLIAARPDLPAAFLAGGIGPANARAAQRVGAFGIDVGSGVEQAPGHKNPAKIAALFNALRPRSRSDFPCA